MARILKTRGTDHCRYGSGRRDGHRYELHFKQGEIVGDLETLPLETYRTYSELFDETLYEAIDLKNCMEKRISEGGTSVASVEKQIAFVRKELDQ